MEKIGLIAGNRKFPIIFSQAAKKKGCYLVAVAIKRDTSPSLRKYVDKIYWLGLNEFRRLSEVFKSEGVTKVVMAGQISPRRLFSREVRKDKDLQELLSGIKDKKAETIFRAVAEKLRSFGLEVIDSTTFIEEFLPKEGLLTKRPLSSNESADISFGLGLAKKVAYLDIGQTIAVKGKAVVAVEALEGTDNLIRRAGRIAGKGFVMVKVSKPGQDMRFDIPVIGLNTVKNLIRAGASCLAIEEGKTLFIDREESVNLANRKGLAIIAVKENEGNISKES